MLTTLRYAGERAFAMNAYQKRYVALEVFYLGAAYNGFASQADTELTVEVSAKYEAELPRPLQPISEATSVKAAPR